MLWKTQSFEHAQITHVEWFGGISNKKILSHIERKIFILVGKCCTQIRHLLRFPAICEVGRECQGWQALTVDRCLCHLAPLGRTGRQHYIGEFVKQKTTISATWTWESEEFWLMQCWRGTGQIASTHPGLMFNIMGQCWLFFLHKLVMIL